MLATVESYLAQGETFFDVEIYDRSHKRLIHVDPGSTERFQSREQAFLRLEECYPGECEITSPIRFRRAILQEGYYAPPFKMLFSAYLCVCGEQLLNDGTLVLEHETRVSYFCIACISRYICHKVDLFFGPYEFWSHQTQQARHDCMEPRRMQPYNIFGFRESKLRPSQFAQPMDEEETLRLQVIPSLI